MINKLQEKGTLESVVLGFDFKRETTGVSNPTIVVYVDAGTDSNPAQILFSSPEVDDVNPALVKQRVAGGLDQVNYRIQCTVDTAEGDRLTCSAIVPVRSKL